MIEESRLYVAANSVEKRVLERPLRTKRQRWALRRGSNVGFDRVDLGADLNLDLSAAQRADTGYRFLRLMTAIRS